MKDKVERGSPSYDRCYHVELAKEMRHERGGERKD